MLYADEGVAAVETIVTEIETAIETETVQRGIVAAVAVAGVTRTVAVGGRRMSRGEGAGGGRLARGRGERETADEPRDGDIEAEGRLFLYFSAVRSLLFTTLCVNQ